jgi:hypothetical protein
VTLVEQLRSSTRAVPIPEHLKHAFAPAACCVWEWEDYWLELPEAQHIQVGQAAPQKPIEQTHVFHLRFESQLGLAQIHLLDSDGRSFDSATVEVISPKTAQSKTSPSLQSHVAFWQALLDDLHQRAAQLPFTIAAPTGRGVTESLRPPTPLFTYYFLRQHAEEIHQAVNIILADPHRLLSEQSEYVPLFQASEADSDVLLEILHNPSEWISVHDTVLGDLPLAKMLDNRLPRRVWQRLPAETFDSAENRFVLAFLEQLLVAAESLPAQLWWKNVPSEHRAAIHALSSLLRQTIYHPMFAEVGILTYLPLSSQVLLRREGYRDVLLLWQRFHQARRPLFEPLQRAIDLRDVAMLYEIWVFFALSQAIACALGEQPTLELKLSDEHGLVWSSAAHFGKHQLIYNQQFSGHNSTFRSYSRSMRPDFVWVDNGIPAVIFDAKFRLQFEIAKDDNDIPATAPVLDDLYKMHTYHDALGVPAVVSLYPGGQSIFYDSDRGRLTDIDVADLLAGGLSGVGAIPMSPIANSEMLVL